jgi:hypothetical protein
MAIQAQPPSWVKSCFVKVRYEHHDEAQLARKRNLQIYGALQQIYHCSWCEGYHLTTTAKRRF